MRSSASARLTRAGQHAVHHRRVAQEEAGSNAPGCSGLRALAIHSGFAGPRAARAVKQSTH